MRYRGDIEAGDRGRYTAPSRIEVYAMPRPVVFLVSHSAMGGVQEIWADLAEGFAAAGKDARLVALYPHEQSMPRPAGSIQWRFVVDRKPKGLIGGFKLLLALIQEIRRERPERIISAMPAANAAAPLAALVAGKSTRVTLSHHTPVETYNRVLNGIDTLFGSLSVVDGIVAVSKAVGNSLERKPLAYRAKRLIIPNALPPRIECELQGLTNLSFREKPERRVVVAIGRLAEQKNPSVLIRAAALMPDVEIHFIGSGPLEPQLRAQAARTGVSDRVRFFGEQTRADALRLLATGDVFCQPSLFEGHSLALIEAAKLKLPLVVSDVPVQVEGITARDGSLCGVAVPTHDEKRLAAEILHLMDDTTAYRDASAKAAKLATDATYEAMVRRYLDLAAHSGAR